ncbi:hypothetical protein QIA17_00250 (plasmid) [Borreliella californiensis]|uniref:Antigen, S1 n=1 Tax=Borreliella californiensis TaxID=373543 RepID=A0A7W9ZMA4_9SPIR|nr:hypothetical protein [Borreliella californiensis]MBB6213363.1 hypothetical protein [Borreliella californiensis]MBB6213478.1 hypothetical protein [Borreliella californiensis]WKC91270.1 hypothetical protein QIA17_00250 [Borreliella californiensis]WNY70929.1 hypothetical protein QIA39_04495 [Borreliella californiensis]
MNKIGIAFISFMLIVNCNSKSLEEDLKSTNSGNKQNLISNEKKSLDSSNNRLKDSSLSNLKSKKNVQISLRESKGTKKDLQTLKNSENLMSKNPDQSSNNFDNLDNSGSLQKPSSNQNINKSKYGKALLKNTHDEIWISHLNLEEVKNFEFFKKSLQNDENRYALGGWLLNNDEVLAKYRYSEKDVNHFLIDIGKKRWGDLSSKMSTLVRLIENYSDKSDREDEISLLDMNLCQQFYLTKINAGGSSTDILVALEKTIDQQISSVSKELLEFKNFSLTTKSELDWYLNWKRNLTDEEEETLQCCRVLLDGELDFENLDDLFKRLGKEYSRLILRKLEEIILNYDVNRVLKEMEKTGKSFKQALSSISNKNKRVLIFKVRNSLLEIFKLYYNNIGKNKKLYDYINRMLNSLIKEISRR